MDEDAAEEEVADAVRVLEVYRAENLALERGDAMLLDTVHEGGHVTGFRAGGKR